MNNNISSYQKESICLKDLEVAQTNNNCKSVQHNSKYEYFTELFEQEKNKHQYATTIYHDYCILAVDNDEIELSIADCLALLKQRNVAAAIAPLKNNNAEAQERYRILIRIDQEFPIDITKEDYKFISESIAKDLDLEDYASNTYLNEPDKLYFIGEGINANEVKYKFGDPIKLDTYLEKLYLRNYAENFLASLNVHQVVPKGNEVATQAIVSDKQNNIPKIAHVIDQCQKEGDIYIYNLSEISSNDILEIIKYLEGIEYTRNLSDGIHVKTCKNNHYQLFDDASVLYDFQDQITYSIFSYVRKLFNGSVEKMLEHIGKFIDLDKCRCSNEIHKGDIAISIKTARNKKEFQEELIKSADLRDICIASNFEDNIYVIGERFNISILSSEKYKNITDTTNLFLRNKEQIYLKP